MITMSITYSLFNTNSHNKLVIGDNYGVTFLYYFQWLSKHRKHTRLFSCSECDISRSFAKFETVLLLDLFLCLLLTVTIHVKTMLTKQPLVKTTTLEVRFQLLSYFCILLICFHYRAFLRKVKVKNTIYSSTFKNEIIFCVQWNWIELNWNKKNCKYLTS